MQSLIFSPLPRSLKCKQFSVVDEEEPDASTPFQVFEDMLEDNISSRYIYYNKEAYSNMIHTQR